MSNRNNPRSFFLTIALAFLASPGLVYTDDAPQTEDRKSVTPVDVTEDDARKIAKLRQLARDRAEQARQEADKAASDAEKAAEEAERKALFEAVQQAVDPANAIEADGPPEPDPAEQQLTEFIRRFARSEIYLLHKVVPLSREQIQTLDTNVEQEIHKQVKLRRGNNIQAQQLRDNGIIMGFRVLNGRRVAVNSRSDFRTTIRSIISKTAETLIPPEQFAAYNRELEARDLARKQASIQALVARIDRELSLSESQRAQLQEVLLKSWNQTWCPPPEEISLYQLSQLPPIPPKLVEPILSNSQKSAWRGLQKNRNPVNFEELMINNGANIAGLTDADLGIKRAETPDQPQNVPPVPVPLVR